MPRLLPAAARDWLNRASVLGSGLLALTGALVLAGWQPWLEALLQLRADDAPMRLDTGLSIFLLGLALLREPGGLAVIDPAFVLTRLLDLRAASLPAASRIRARHVLVVFCSGFWASISATSARASRSAWTGSSGAGRGSPVGRDHVGGVAPASWRRPRPGRSRAGHKNSCP